MTSPEEEEEEEEEVEYPIELVVDESDIQCDALDVEREVTLGEDNSEEEEELLEADIPIINDEIDN